MFFYLKHFWQENFVGPKYIWVKKVKTTPIKVVVVVVVIVVVFVKKSSPKFS